MAELSNMARTSSKSKSQNCSQSSGSCKSFETLCSASNHKYLPTSVLAMTSRSRCNCTAMKAFHENSSKKPSAVEAQQEPLQLER